MSDAVKVEEREIVDHRFLVRKIPAADQFRLMNRMMNIIGEGVGGIGKLELPSTESDAMDWVALIGKVAGSTDPDKATNLIMEIIFIARVELDGNLKQMDKNYFNRVFSGDLMGAWKLAAFVLEVQYSDFLEPLLGAFNQAAQQEEKTTRTSGGKLPQE